MLNLDQNLHQHIPAVSWSEIPLSQGALNFPKILKRGIGNLLIKRGDTLNAGLIMKGGLVISHTSN